MSMTKLEKSQLDALEYEVQLALARARAAVAALGNHQALTPGGAIGPATQITWIGNPITPLVSGKMLVIGMISVVDGTIDDSIQFQLIRNPTSATGAPGGVGIGSTPTSSNANTSNNGGVACTLPWIDSVPVGTPVTYGVTAISGGGHNLQTNPNGAGAAIVVLELPG